MVMNWTGKFNKEKLKTLPMNCGRRLYDNAGYCVKGLLAASMEGLEELDLDPNTLSYEHCIRIQAIKKRLPAFYEEASKLEHRMIVYKEEVREDLLNLVKEAKLI